MKLERVQFTHPVESRGLSSVFTKSQGWEIELNEQSGLVTLERTVGTKREAFVAMHVGAYMDPLREPEVDVVVREVIAKVEIPPPPATPAESPNAKKGKRY